MKFFVESADLGEIRACVERGTIGGVSIAASPPGDRRRALIQEVCALYPGPVSAELPGGTPDHPLPQVDQIVREARALARLAPNLVVRLPSTDDGLQAVQALSASGIRTQVAGCRSPAGAILAARVGATYLSPIGGRIDDVVTDGIDLVRKIIAAYKTYELATEVLVTTAGNAAQVVEAALAGAQIAAVSFALLERLIGDRAA
jgi:transaldolase